jgi:hypothetical protein
MQTMLVTIATIRVFVAGLSVLVGVYCAAHWNRSVPLQALVLMFSLLILNSVFGLLGVSVNSANSFFVAINIVAVVALLLALNILVFRALGGNPPNPTVKRDVP